MGSLLQSRKKWAFSLPSFRRSSAGERLEAPRRAEAVARNAEEVVRIQKAAAWQWYMHGAGEAVVPATKTPPAVGTSPPSQAPPGIHIDQSCRSKGQGQAVTNTSSVLQKKPLEAPPADHSPRAASRFKAEAEFFTQHTTSAGAAPPSSAPSTPLYDEFELSGFRTQMADFVERLTHQQTKDIEQSPGHVRPGEHQKLKPLHNVAVHGGLANSVSTNSQHSKAPSPAVAAATSSDHPLTNLAPSTAPVTSTNPFHMRPLSALHRLFRKVVSGSTPKSSKNSPLMIFNSQPGAVCEPEVLPEEDDDNMQYHYHHYIHHHHHHYHYSESPEESDASIRSRRRHSESSGIRPHIPRLWEAESDEEEEDVEESPIDAYLARRTRRFSNSKVEESPIEAYKLARRIRRFSDSFAGHLPPQKADFDEDEAAEKLEPAKASLWPQSPRRYNSNRFPPNKIPTMVNKHRAQPAAGGKLFEFDEGLAEMKCRRHSAENLREGPSLEKAAGGGKSEGGIHSLGGAVGGANRQRHLESLQRPEAVHHEMGKQTPSPGGGKSGGGIYKLSGAADGTTPAMPLDRRRRHSESLQRPEAVHHEMGKHTPSPGRPYWHSPSARFYDAC